MKINIHIEADSAEEAQKAMAQFARAGNVYYRSEVPELSPLVSYGADAPAIDPAAITGKDFESKTLVTNTPRAGESEEQTAARRERGKPAPGRARRTKEEIAEDEAADKADAERGAQMDEANAAIDAAHAKTRGSISSDPENRAGPEDEPETQEQDKADEQAEVEANRDAEAPLTGEDVRNAMGLYVKKFGLPATQEDGAAIFLNALGAPPKGAEGWKLSVVSEQDQPTLRKAIDAWTSAANADARYVAKGGA
jgi:hypothetical protein